MCRLGMFANSWKITIVYYNRVMDVHTPWWTSREMMGVKGVSEIRQVKLVGNIATRLAS